MADAVAAGAPIDHVYADNLADYHDSSYCRCFLPSPDTQLPHVSHYCTLFHEQKPVRSADTPLLTAIRGGLTLVLHRNPLGLAVFTQTVGSLAVKFLLDNGASFDMGTGSLLMPILAHMSRCRIPDLCWKAPVSIPLYGCETKASLLLSTHEPLKDCSCIPSYDSLNQHGEIDPGVRYYAWDDSHLPYGGPEISKVFRFLREHGLPIVRSGLDEIYSNAIPPLIKATRSSNPEAVRLLIEEGEDPNARCPLELCGHFPLGFRIGFRQGLGGRTALAYACAEMRKNQPQVVRQLLEGGADPMGRTAEGLTPIQILSRSLPERGTVQVLLDFKARPSTLGL
ncbi:hypothetical protein CSOJ01_10900 [Colletotrichum sojae]|uniref:Ankyrin repeat protein n=1 Tax=Colletotrichum sojae TaxID=2175907 RepID=A0A8H6IZC4_9PEZI|nr:hypothetical protein CSOJ01_10900 [Colletotrichum sojae]